MTTGKSRTGREPTVEQFASFWNEKWTECSEHMGDSSLPSMAFNLLKIDTTQAKLVLDVGCGEYGTAYAMDRDKISRHIVQLDISTVALKLAKQHGSNNGSTFDYVQSIATKLPFPNNSFDMVTAFETVTLLGKAYPEAIREMWRITRDYMIFNVTYKGPLLTKGRIEGILQLAGFYEDGTRKMLAALSPKEVRLRTVTVDEFANWGVPQYHQTHYENGDDKMTIIAMARK